MVKHKARKQLRAILAQLSQEQLHRKSVAACDKLSVTPEFERSMTMMLFLSLPEEVDTAHAILKAFQQDKTVVIPSVAWDKKHMIPITLTSLDCETTCGRHGVRYPAHGEPMPASEIDLAVVPGLGFDGEGNRMGRGGGFYDRFLSSDGFKGIICGLALEEQIVERIPVHDHDVKVQMLVTDKSVRRFGNIEEK